MTTDERTDLIEKYHVIGGVINEENMGSLIDKLNEGYKLIHLNTQFVAISNNGLPVHNVPNICAILIK